jgi:hypothetical protein
MTAYRVTVAELADLGEVSIVCSPGCEMRMCLSVTTGILPDRCPSCGKVFNEHLKTAFVALGRFFREGQVSESKIEFLIREKMIQ